jgi:hypothetical protein
MKTTIATITLVCSLCACGGVEKESVIFNTDDSVLVESQKHIQITNEVLDSADSRVSESVYSIVVDIQQLKSENQKLKTEYNKLKKTRIQRDTIYVTEKKNFWGKTKRSVDSSQSITEDSTIIN